MGEGGGRGRFWALTLFLLLNGMTAMAQTDGGITPEMLEGDGLLIKKGKKSYHRLVKKG